MNAAPQSPPVSGLPTLCPRHGMSRNRQATRPATCIGLPVPGPERQQSLGRMVESRRFGDRSYRSGDWPGISNGTPGFAARITTGGEPVHWRWCTQMMGWAWQAPVATVAFIGSQ